MTKETLTNMNFVFSLALSCAGICLVIGFTANRNSIIPRNYADVVDLRGKDTDAYSQNFQEYVTKW